MKETSYLVDHQNFTGYQQVVREVLKDGSGNVLKQIDYTFGHDEISQRVVESDGAGAVTSDTTSIFAHDGHGSVRMLMDMAGAIANIAGTEQFYIYDAYGNLLNMAANAAATTLLYSGEQFDSRIGQQYLRARYYDPNSGRFNRLDPFFGNHSDPQSFHKYLYTHADPVNGIDPTGLLRVSPSIFRMFKGFMKKYGKAAGVELAVRILIGIRATYALVR